MAYQLVWSPLSRDDLHSIVRFISRDNPTHAQSFGLRLIARVEMLQMQPEMGRMLSEHRSTQIREIVFRPYRIVYRVDHSDRRVDIVRV